MDCKGIEVRLIKSTPNLTVFHRMRVFLLLIVIISVTKKLNGQNYIRYFNIANEAENKFLVKNYQAAKEKLYFTRKGV